MMLNQTKKVLVSSLGLLTVVGLALADDTSSGYSGLETMEQPQVEHIIQVNPGFTYLSEADFDNSILGNVSVWRMDVPARYTMKMGAGDLGFGAFYEYSEYDLERLAGTLDFNTLAFDTFWKAMINDEWGYFLYGSVNLSASTEAALSDGVTGMGGGGVRYVWSKDLSLGLGAVVATRLEDDPGVLPVIALNWQISDRWNLRTLNGATITYDVSGDKTFLLDLGAKYQRREYRVGGDSARRNVGGDYSLTEKMISMELGATYRFCPEFAVRGFVGVAAGREFEVRRNGNEVGDGQDVDASPFVGVRALFTF
jgi:hypothetical protein